MLTHILVIGGSMIAGAVGGYIIAAVTYKTKIDELCFNLTTTKKELNQLRNCFVHVKQQAKNLLTTIQNEERY